MDTVTSPAAILVLGSLTLLSLADLRDRALPGIRIFFIAGVVFGVVWGPAGSVVKVGAVVLAVGWGMHSRFPTALAFLALIHPSAWPVMLAAVGVRQQKVSLGDLLAIGAVACLLPWYVPYLAFLGVYLWGRFWRNKGEKTLPALPGFLFGVLLSIWVRMLL